jgi:hypothetical protein
VWCRDKLPLNISTTKELIVDNRTLGGKHSPIHINGAVLERVESFKFLRVQISKDLKWSTCTTLRRLKRFGIDSKILKRLYSCTIESVLIRCIAALERMALQKVMWTAQYITWAELPAIQVLYTRRCERKDRQNR